MLMTLPLERRTEAVCRRAIEIDGENIRYVPRDMRTEKLCYTAVQSWDYALDYVPEELKTPSMCMAAVERYGRRCCSCRKSAEQRLCVKQR